MATYLAKCSIPFHRHDGYHCSLLSVILIAPWFECAKLHPCEKVSGSVSSRMVKAKGREGAGDLQRGALRPSGEVDDSHNLHQAHHCQHGEL